MCPGRLASPPSPDHASTIQFLAAGPAAAAFLARAASLLGALAEIYGDQEARAHHLAQPSQLQPHTCTCCWLGWLLADASQWRFNGRLLHTFPGVARGLAIPFTAGTQQVL